MVPGTFVEGGIRGISGEGLPCGILFGTCCVPHKDLPQSQLLTSVNVVSFAKDITLARVDIDA